MSSNQLRLTRKIELVETHNLALSIERLNGPPYDGGERMKRAIYHGFALSNCVNRSTLEKIRVALELP